MKTILSRTHVVWLALLVLLIILVVLLRSCLGPSVQSTSTSSGPYDLIVYTNMADMLANASTKAPNKLSRIMGYYYPGDGGGGDFLATTNTNGIDGGMKILSTLTPTAAWQRLLTDGTPINVKMFGARGDGTDDYAAISKCLASLGPNRTIVFPRGTFGLGQPLIVTNESIHLKGDGPMWTRLKYINSVPVDCVVELRSAVYPNHDYYMNMSDLGIEGSSFTTNALRLSRVCHSTYNNITLGGASDTYLRIDGQVLATFNDLRASHLIGISSGPQPRHGIYLDGVAAGQNFSNSILFNGAIVEGTSDYGVVLTNGTCHVVWDGGTVEACAAGFLITANSSANSIKGVDCEGNSGLDLVVERNSNFNVFETFLGTTGVLLNSAGSTLVGGRFGSVTFDTNSATCTAIGTMYNVYGLGGTNGAWTDRSGGPQNTWIGRFDNGTGARDSRFLIDSSTSPGQSLVRSPFRVLHSSWDTNYSLLFGSHDISGGVVNFDVMRYNQGAGLVTNMTFGLRGNVSFGYPAIDTADARVSVNGSLNVGASTDPGPGWIEATNLRLRARAATTLAMWDTAKNLVSGNTLDLTVDASNIIALAPVAGNVGTFGNASTIPVVTVNTKGLVTAVGTVPVASTGLTGPLTGDVTTVGPTGTATTLKNTGPGAGTYGSASTVPVLTLDNQGRVTAVTPTPVSVTRQLVLALSNPTIIPMAAQQTNFVSLPVPITITAVTGKLLKAGNGTTTLTLRNGIGGAVIQTIQMASSETTHAYTVSASIPADTFLVGDITIVGTGGPYGAQIVLSYTTP